MPQGLGIAKFEPLTSATPPLGIAKFEPLAPTPLPATATRGMLPPSTMAGGQAPFNPPRLVQPREQTEEPLITPRLAAGYSPTLTVGGRRGRFNFDLPPETGGTPRPRYVFDTDDGGRWFFQLEQGLQGGRWDDAEHAPADFDRYKALDPKVRTATMAAMWGDNPIASVIDKAASEKVSFAELKKRLKPYNTHRQISDGEPEPVEAVTPGRTGTIQVAPSELTILYRHAKKALSDVWDKTIEPLIPESFVTDAVKTMEAEERRAESEQLKRGESPSVPAAAARGFATGVVEGGRTVVRGLSSPLNIGLQALGIGSVKIAAALARNLASLPKLRDAIQAAKTAQDAQKSVALVDELVSTVERIRNLQTAQAVMRGTQAATGAGFTVEGVANVVNAPTFTEKALGVAQAAGGAAMVVGGVPSARLAAREAAEASGFARGAREALGELETASRVPKPSPDDIVVTPVRTQATGRVEPPPAASPLTTVPPATPPPAPNVVLAAPPVSVAPAARVAPPVATSGPLRIAAFEPIAPAAVAVPSPAAPVPPAPVAAATVPPLGLAPAVPPETAGERSGTTGERPISGTDDLGRGREIVDESVRSSSLKGQVLDPIVGAIPVDVVDMLGGKQRTTEMLLHEPTVLSDRLSSLSEVDVPALIEALLPVIARGRAELAATGVTSRSPEYSAALDTFDRNLRESMTRTTRPEPAPDGTVGEGPAGTTVRAETSTVTDLSGGRDEPVSTEGANASDLRSRHTPIVPSEIPLTGTNEQLVATREPWQMTRTEFRIAENRPRVDAIKAALKRGTRIVLTTNAKATRLAIPEHIRMTASGEVQIPRGRSWDTLTEPQIEALAAQAGVKPIPLAEKVFHLAAVEEALAAGKAVPANVLDDYPNLKTDILPTGEAQPRLPEAGAVREQDIRTPQIEAPFSLAPQATERTGVQPGLLDRIQPEAQTVERGPEPRSGEGVGEEGLSAPRRVEPSVARRSESRRQREARATEHYAAVFDLVLEHAREVDPAVDPAIVKAEFDFRIGFINDQLREFQESGQNPRNLLRAIAANGGLGPESVGGLTGELRWLKEGTRGGVAAGVANVFRQQRTLDARGQPKTGLGFDVMVQRLQQDPEFAWVENTDILIDAIYNAMRHGATLGETFPGTKELAKSAQMRPDEAWWEDSWRAPRQASEQPGEASEAGLEAADTSFNPSEFEQGGGGGGESNVGIFAEPEPTTAQLPQTQTDSRLFPPPGAPATTGTIRPAEFPELVELAKRLQDTPEVVRAFRKVGKMGEFRPGGIRLAAELFKKGNEYQLAAALAHELGHLVDWLPNKTLKRGNLLGRLLTMQSFLTHTFTAVDGTTVKNADIRKELLALSDEWRPWDPDTASASFRAYRHSGKELYADALSVLLKNPGILQTQAPIFYREFFAALDRKPDVKAAYFDLQEVLSGTREELIARRIKGDLRMFTEGDVAALDLERRRRNERVLRAKELWLGLKMELVDKNYVFIDRVRALERQGTVIPDDVNPVYMLEERNYLGAQHKAFVERHFAPVWKTAIEADVPWNYVGLGLLYERVIAGDRTEYANPRGLSPAGAQEQYTAIQRELGTERAKVLKDTIATFREPVRAVTKQAHAAGLITDEQYANAKANPAYATFQVIEHIEDGVSSRFFRQKGTLKDITNTANATILKTLVTLRAIEHQKVKQAAFAFLKQSDPGAIQPAKLIWTGKGHRPIESKDPKKALITYFEKGHPRGYYVDPYIATSLNNNSIGTNWAVLKILRLPNQVVFRPLFTTFNLGFQGFNVWRDFWRYWKNVPDVTLQRALRRYLEAVPLARMRAFGVPDQLSAKQLQTYKDLLDAQEYKILGPTFNDVIMGREVEDTQIEQIFVSSGVPGFRVTPRMPVMRQLVAVLESIKEVGDFIETLPKAAGIYEFKGSGSISDIAPSQRSFIRRKVGSPDFLAGGTWKPVSNEIMLFSNAITQAWRSDLEVATQPKTRGGYWWKTAKLNLLPKVVMWAALAGLLGEDLRRMYQRVTEYDRTNYISPTLGEDEHGNTIYVRLPQDDSGRFVAGLFWKAIRLFRDDPDVVKSLMDVVDYTAGQFPGVSPTITTARDVISMAAGQQIRDDFRGRDLFTRDELAARDARTLKKFLGWEFQNLGGGIVWKFYPGEQRPRKQTTGQWLIELPVLSNIVGRFIRITNFGEMESLRQAGAQVQREEARGRLSEREAIGEVLRALQAPATYQDNATVVSRQTAVTRAAVKIAAEVYRGDTVEAMRRLPEIRQALQLGVLRSQSDPVIDTILSATSNKQKLAILRAAIKQGQLQAPETVGAR